jgi:hypothetical protein
VKKHIIPFKQVNNLSGKIFFTILFFAGLTSAIFEIDIYRKTFIPIAIPIAIYLLTGLLSTPFFLKTLPPVLEKTGLFYQFIFNTLSWGGVATCLFMATNFYFSKNDRSAIELTILGSGNLAKGRSGCATPYAEVNYQGIDKELMFPCETIVSKYNTIILTLDKGLLGYDVVKSQKLLSQPAVILK